MTPIQRARLRREVVAYMTTGTSVGSDDRMPSMLIVGVVIVRSGKAIETK
jgi:hypothetical protein